VLAPFASAGSRTFGETHFSLRACLVFFVFRAPSRFYSSPILASSPESTSRTFRPHLRPFFPPLLRPVFFPLFRCSAAVYPTGCLSFPHGPVPFFPTWPEIFPPLFPLSSFSPFAFFVPPYAFSANPLLRPHSPHGSRPGFAQPSLNLPPFTSQFLTKLLLAVACVRLATCHFFPRPRDFAVHSPPCCLPSSCPSQRPVLCFVWSIRKLSWLIGPPPPPTLYLLWLFGTPAGFMVGCRCCSLLCPWAFRCTSNGWMLAVGCQTLFLNSPPPHPPIDFWS